MSGGRPSSDLFLLACLKVWTEQTHHGILNMDEGPGSSDLYAFGCGAMSFTGVGITLQNGDYYAGLEIESPLDGSTPIEIYGSATIDGLMIGPPNSKVKGKSGVPKWAHYDTLIKVDASAAQPWGVRGGWHGAPGGGSANPGVRASRGWSVTGLMVDNSSDQGDGNGTTWDNVITVNGKGLDASWSSEWLLRCCRLARMLAFWLIGFPARRHVVAQRCAIHELRRHPDQQTYPRRECDVCRPDDQEAVLPGREGRRAPAVLGWGAAGGAPVIAGPLHRIFVGCCSNCVLLLLLLLSHCRYYKNSNCCE